MRFMPGRLRPKLAVLACAVYGVTVTLLTFAPALVALWRVTRPDARHGVVSVTADNTLMMHISMTSAHLPTWTGSVNLGTLILWLLAPPLLIWAGWLAISPRQDHSTPERDEQPLDVAALNQPDFDPAIPRQAAEWEATSRRDR